MRDLPQQRADSLDEDADRCTQDRGVEGATVIDIGGGIGAVQHELLAAGAAHVTSIAASDAYIRTAREESDRRGLTARVTYHHGDFLELAEAIPPADIVTLDRVINVYPNWKRLNPSFRGTRSPPVRPRLSTQHSARQDGGQSDEPSRVARTRPRVCALAGGDRQAGQ
jgi:Methyltransferase domain